MSHSVEWKGTVCTVALANGVRGRGWTEHEALSDAMKESINPTNVHNILIRNRKLICWQIGEWIKNNPGANTTLGLVRLVLSLYNGRAYPYALSTCMKALDAPRAQWAMQFVEDYMTNGETPELHDLARKIIDGKKLNA